MNFKFTFVITFNAFKQQARNKRGNPNLTIIKPVIKNGENVETKHRTQFGSKELIEAIFPVPKREINKYST